ncbi:MAG TPA: AP2 domain-containing protein [Ktedonobacteraceae bacterium]|jgi:hypothetical protein|nr:AP2 domain-containing protein [Ktedonobacteraceae bacterium]
MVLAPRYWNSRSRDNKKGTLAMDTSIPENLTQHTFVFDALSSPQNNIPTILIPLSQGKFALIDEIDRDLAQYKWHVQRGYAVRHGSGISQQHGRISLHRTILERKLGRPLLPHPQEVTDHQDLDTLNNRRENLRLATIAQNVMNRGKISSTRPYKGVFSHQNKWRATISVDGKFIHLGLYDTPEEAAIQYNKAALHYYQDFARINEGLPDIQVESTVGRLYKRNTSGYRGVIWEKRRNHWVAQIKHQGKHIYLGAFDTAEEAACAYNEASIRIFGSHAYTNIL